ncbi:RidA family protein [Pontibacter virosus]|uniref:Enamine deaminase RidA (YjgF/YER057c/UK114 family) n=1 Tax=Pontibacter virosus TaxID=1765052 RepID=A0A2U1B585_9BACT|nr:RidA family protein [Pontibacter virosus]PVY43835.1 enamine deaminase RidA (YjgF/YER057c/UK114 family) [Pontibacter virosus]
MKNHCILLIAFLIGFTFNVQAQGQKLQNGKIFHLHPAGEQDWNYAQAYRSGNMLYLSGTVGKGDMDQAMERVYKTIELTLKQYGLDLTHAVKENLYATDIEAAKKSQPIRKKYYGTHTPAATWVQVSRLFEEDTVLEVEVIAEIKKTE